MNESQLRHLVVSFRHIDELLGEAVRNLSAEADASPFARYTQDASPVQRKVVADHVAGIRRAMARIMDEVGAPRPAPVSGALWAAQSQVAAARIAIDELRPRVMRGYGALSDADAVRLDGIAAELDAALERLLAYLAQGPDADLPARLQRLEQTRDEVPLLRELARIVTDHGLVGLRGTLSLLLERLEGDGFEIGVFGRVSSGKSSLLNRLLGAPVLPVGVTPVTAVPTRIRLGEHSRAMIEFAQSPPLTIGLERLPEFSTEQQNPGNRKHVTRILVEVPAGRLPPGVTWVDTPGLGSLATDGAAETDAYLPRCDLGLVLIDAGAVPTPEDFALVQRLLRAGASAMVLVSKADLLDAPDRQRVVDYVRQQLGAQLGTPLAVYPVSVKDAAASLCEAWFDEALQPLLRTHGEQAAAAMRRKIGLFREAVERTLEARLGQPAAAPRYAAALAALRAGDELCEAARRAA
ncbi:MAG: dynamin family protein, partial [Rhodocyclaceae bacterium]|nr:dynamin family protein [Rhodocyclaceae bacterium]